MRIIELQPCDERWPSKYNSEMRALKTILSDVYISSHHIGSTAIKGIMAKPTIDILIEVSDLAELDKLQEDFRRLGYIAKGEHGTKGRRFFYKGEESRTHHVHAFESGNPEIQRHILFAEFLNRNLVIARDYENLKMKLANKFRSSPA